MMKLVSRLVFAVMLVGVLMGACEGRGERRLRHGNAVREAIAAAQQPDAEPTVRYETDSCSYVINIPAPENCKHFEEREELDSLKERVRVLEGILSDLVDSKHATRNDPSCPECPDEYSIEEHFSSSALDATDSAAAETNSAPIGEPDDKKTNLQEVLVPSQPLPPLREVILPGTTHHVPYINSATPPRVKPYQEDLVAPHSVHIQLNATAVNEGRKDPVLVVPIPPKKPSTITSTRPSGSNTGASVDENIDELEVDMEGPFEVDQAAPEADLDIDEGEEDEEDLAEEAENQAMAYFPDVPEVESHMTSERSMTSELEGGSYIIFSSSDGGAEEDLLRTDADGEHGETDPTEVRDEDGEAAAPGDTDVTPAGTNARPFMKVMTSQDGHGGDLVKPRWKVFKELMDLKTLRGQMTDGGKRPRPKGMGKPNDCVLDGCLCLRKKGFTEDGIYYVENPSGSGKRGKHVRLYCDMTTEGGGWTVIQRRQNGTTNFYRNWDDYAKGFGYLDGDFWVGNSMLHAITSQTTFALRVEFTDWDDQQGYAEYNLMRVQGESDHYRLILGQYMGGNAGDALSYHNNTKFSTRDTDHDSSIGNCAFLRQAGFWFRACNKANPNGRWLARADARGLNGAVVSWGTWEGRKYSYCLKTFRMMIRSHNTLSALTAGSSERTADGERDRASRGRGETRGQTTSHGRRQPSRN